MARIIGIVGVLAAIVLMVKLNRLLEGSALGFIATIVWYAYEIRLDYLEKEAKDF